VKEDVSALEWASESLKGNKEVVLSAVKQDGSALEWASESLKGNKEVVLSAVKQDGSALEWASKPLKGDEEVVLSAAKQDLSALEWASEPLMCDKGFARMAMRVNFYAFSYLSAKLKADETVFFEALRACYHGSGSSRTLAEASDLTKSWRALHFRAGDFDVDYRRRVFQQDPERVFANHLAFPGTPGAVTFTLLESHFDAPTSKWHCVVRQGLGGADSFLVKLAGRTSSAPSFAQLSKALTKGLRGSFIYLVIGGNDGNYGNVDQVVNPLDGEEPIPMIERPPDQKRPSEQSPQEELRQVCGGLRLRGSGAVVPRG